MMTNKFTKQMVNYFKEFSKENTDDFNTFKNHISKILNHSIKPISTFNLSNKKDNSWRFEQKQKFSGRGNQWVFVSLDEIKPTLKRLKSEGFNTSFYEEHINRIGKAWVRYAGPKLGYNNLPVASFEVRLEGSTKNSKALYYHDNRNLNSLERLPEGKTPKKLKLEENPSNIPKIKIDLISSKKANNVDVLNIKTIKEKVDESDDLISNVTLPEPPKSNDPIEWEKFLDKEDLNAKEDSMLIDEIFAEL
tara:strand:- start:653 stop:1399 length:747 start_codon:yes stop_codon:yes gene_type:complete